MTAQEITEEFRARLEAVVPRRRFEADEVARMLAHQRLLTAVVGDDPAWLVKGSFALQLLYPKQARVARDLDITYGHGARVGMGNFPFLNERIATGDGFEFECSPSVERSKELHAVNYALSCNTVRARWKGQAFLTTEADVSLYEESWFSEGETALPPGKELGPLAASAGVFPIRYQLAEKLHAYSLPLPPFSEDADWKGRHLADIALMLEKAAPEPGALADALFNVFNYRGTHGIPLFLPYARSYRNVETAFTSFSRGMDLHVPSLDAVFESLTELWDAAVKDLHAKHGRSR